LEEIGDYIADELTSPEAALNTVESIQEAIDKLDGFLLMGTPLSSVHNLATDYRFLVCGSYLAFYRPSEDKVFVDRILYGRRDYMAILFPEAQ